jgi:dynein heavy chain
MGKVAQSISDLYEECKLRLKPTPMKVQYVQSQRECFKIICAMARVEGNFLKSELALMKLFYHECMRLYGDRILMRHDLSWFMDALKRVCCDNFSCADGKPEK